MIRIYTDEWAATPASTSSGAQCLRPSPTEYPTDSTTLQRQKAELTITGHTRHDLTLAPKLPFSSYKCLCEAVKHVLGTLPMPAVSLSSLQYRNADGDLLDILQSTFDPQEFVQQGATGNLYLHARVQPVHRPYAKEETKEPAKASGRRRRPLRCRDANVTHSVSVSPHAPTAQKRATVSNLVPGNEKTGRHADSVMGTTSSSRRTTTTADAAVVAAAVPDNPDRILQTRRRGTGTVTVISEGCCISSHSRAGPQFVFGDKSREKWSAIASSASEGENTAPFQVTDIKEGIMSNDKTGVVVRAARKERGVAPAAHRPSWNNRDEPQWEEAEKKKIAMRNAARARILGKRAAAAAKRNQKIVAGQARVIRRAKRDCRVTDARRNRLGAYLFHDPIGTPPLSLGKRNLWSFREMGRQAALAMKYVQIPHDQTAPKRARGNGEGLVVIPRNVCGSGGDGSAVMKPGSSTTSAGGASTVAAVARQHKTDTRKAVALAIDSSKNSRRASRPSSAYKSSNSMRLPPPPTMLPGDIGFRGGSASGGAIMRPPTLSFLLVSSRRAAAAATAAAVSGRQAATGVAGAGGTARAAALTAATAAKLAAAADTQKWSGNLRACSSLRSFPMMVATAKGGRGGGVGRKGGKVGGKRSDIGDLGAAGRSASDKAAAAAIMAKLAAGGGFNGRRGVAGGGGGARGASGDVESLQEQVALLKAASGLSDEELTWRMETSKPGANAYHIASAALDRAEATYERLLWRQGQLEIARARFSGSGRGADNASSSFATAVRRIVASGAPDDRAMSCLQSSAAVVLADLEPGIAGSSDRSGAAAGSVHSASVHAAGLAWPADAAAVQIRASAVRMLRLAEAVEATARTGTEVDKLAIASEVAAELEALSARAAGVEQELRAVAPKVEATVRQVETWQRRRTEAPEFAAEEAACEEAWSEANREANLTALRVMRKLLPEAVWEMNAGDIQAAAAVGARDTAVVDGGERESGEGGSLPAGKRVGGVFYPSDLCVRLRECRPLHWLVSAPEDIAGANFLSGGGSAAFTQLEGMDLIEMRAVWCVLPKEFSRDADGKKAEWRARFRAQLEGLVQQQDRAVITAGWDPVRNRRATCCMPPLSAHRARHPAYFYPTEEAMRSRTERLRDQHRRLETRKARLSALTLELAEAKLEVDAACADARSDALRARYGAEMLRSAREAAKESYAALGRERKVLLASVAEGERTLSATYPSLAQLESEADSVAEILGGATSTTVGTDRSKGEANPADTDSSTATSKYRDTGVNSTSVVRPHAVPGAFSEEPQLRCRASAAAKKLTPQEERLLRASEVRRAVCSREVAHGEALTEASFVKQDASKDSGGGDASDVGGGQRQYLQAVLSMTESREDASRECPQLAGKKLEAVNATTTAAKEGGTAIANGEATFEACGGRRTVSRVKAAPGVLAFLNREYSSRAEAVAVAKGPAPVTESGGGAAESTAASTTSGAQNSLESSGGLGGLHEATTTRAGAAVVVSVVGVPPPPPPAAPPAPPKPMSKSLAAVLTRTAARSSGAGDAKSGEELKRATATSLDFLEELKTRGARTGRGVSTTKEAVDGDPGRSIGGRLTLTLPCGGGGGEALRKRPPSVVTGSGMGGVAFMNELKARTSKIS